MKNRNFSRVMLLVFLLLAPVFSFAIEETNLTLAKRLMNEGLYELAYGEFIDFAEKNGDSPDREEAYYLAYDCLFLQGKYDKALSRFKKFNRAYPFSSFTPSVQERIGEIYLKLKHYEKARETFENFVKLYPESEKVEDALFWLGETHYSMKEYGKARYYYKLCMERYPQGRYCDYVLFSIGFTYRDEKKYDEARKFFERLISNFQESSLIEDALLTLGELSFEKGDYDSALAVYNNYRKEYPKGKLVDKSLFYTGRIYKAQGNNQKAIETFQTIINKYPHSKFKNPALYYIAWLYFEKDEYKNALEHFRMVDKKSKLYFPSFYWSGIILEKMGNAERAREQFEKLGSMQNTGGFRNDALYELARMSYESKDNVKADSLVTLLEKTDRRWKAMLLKGNTLFGEGEYRDATEIYREVLKGPEQNSAVKESVYRLGVSLYRMEDYGEAERELNIYLVHYPDGKYRKEAMLLFAESAYKQKKWNDALTRYRGVKTEFPKTDEAKLAQIGEGWTLSKLGRDREAYNILKKVTSVGGEKKDWLTLGDAAYNAGRFNEAISHYKNAAKEKPVREIALLKLGNTYFRKNRYKDANTSYDALIKEFPMGDLADDAYYKKACALRKLGDYKDSNHTVSSLRKLYPSSEFIGKSYLLSGDNYFNIGDFDNAQIHYQKVVALLSIPEDTSAIVPVQGIMKSIQRKDGEKRAAAFADTYIERFKGTYFSERIRMLKGDMFYYSGDVLEAEKEYGRIENRKLKPVSLFYQAKSLLSLKKNAGAEEKLREIIENFPGSSIVPKASLLLGKVLYEEKKYSESLTFLERITSMETEEDFEVAYIKSEVYLKLNYREKAIKTLKSLGDAANTKWKGKASVRLGDISLKDGKAKEALGYYEEAIKTGESVIITEAYFKKGKALAEQGNDNEALKTFLKVKYNFNDSPFTTKAIFEAAEIAMKLEKKQDAQSLYKEVIERNDDKILTSRAKDRLRTINP